MDGIITLVSEYFAGPLGKVELFATISSLICVWLATKQNIWTWAFGVAGVILFGYLFFQYLLYSDAILQIFFYLPIQFVGWYMWKKGAINDGPQTVRRLPWYAIGLITLGTITATVLTGHVMATYTDASFPYADALTTWMSIAAQLLMLRKYIENWAVWVGMDAIAIFIYAAKGLVVTSGLYVIFFFLAAWGGYIWLRQYHKQTDTARIKEILYA